MLQHQNEASSLYYAPLPASVAQKVSATINTLNDIRHAYVMLFWPGNDLSHEPAQHNLFHFKGLGALV